MAVSDGTRLKLPSVLLPPSLKKVQTVQSLHVVEHNHHHYHYFLAGQPPVPSGHSTHSNSFPASLPAPEVPGVSSDQQIVTGSFFKSPAGQLVPPAPQANEMSSTWQSWKSSAASSYAGSAKQSRQIDPVASYHSDGSIDVDDLTTYPVDSATHSIGRRTVGLQTCLSMPDLGRQENISSSSAFGRARGARHVASTTLPCLVPDRRTRFKRLAKFLEKRHEDEDATHLMDRRTSFDLGDGSQHDEEDDKTRKTLTEGRGFSFRTKRASIIEQHKNSSLNASKPLPIEELRQMPAVEAIRQALIFRAGSLKEAYTRMDVNTSGSVSLNEFQSGLQSLRIDWLSVTGKAVNVLFRELDADQSGELSLEELLGYIPEDDQDFRDTRTLWAQYFNKTSASKTCLGRHPKWGSDKNITSKSLEDMMKPLEDQREQMRYKDEVKRHFKELSKQGPSPSRFKGFSKRDLLGDPKMRGCSDVEDVEKVKKEELEGIRETVRKVQVFMRDCGRSRKQIVDLQKSMQSVDGSKAKAAESHEARRASIAMKMAGGGPGENPGLAMKLKKDDPDKLNFEVELSEEDKYVRKVAHEMGVPLVDVEDIYKRFCEVDADKSGFIERPEFNSLVKSLHQGAEVRQGMLDDWWRAIDQNKVGKVNFEEFLQWWLVVMGGEQ